MFAYNLLFWSCCALLCRSALAQADLPRPDRNWCAERQRGDALAHCSTVCVRFGDSMVDCNTEKCSPCSDLSVVDFVFIVDGALARAHAHPPRRCAQRAFALLF